MKKSYIWIKPLNYANGILNKYFKSINFELLKLIGRNVCFFKDPDFVNNSRSHLLVGLQLHRSPQLQILFTIPHLADDSHADHSRPLPNACRVQQRGPHAHSDHNLVVSHCGGGHIDHTDRRPHQLSHCAGDTRTHHQRTGDGQISNRRESVRRGLLAELEAGRMRLHCAQLYQVSSQ